MEAFEGVITIDDVDISKLSMFALRSKLSLIPQDPVLFAGTVSMRSMPPGFHIIHNDNCRLLTNPLPYLGAALSPQVRFNLDPFGNFDEHVLWSALERAHLKDVVLAMDKGIDSMIVENGANFSVGQRQLVCLARALVRRSSILVLDEATASVDIGTDALIQKTIREEFASCTVLAIAHRLNTIIDSDRILVLDGGKKVEFGTPAELLSNPDGVFTSMVDSTGAQNAQFLRDVAAGQVNLKEVLSSKSMASDQGAQMRCRTVDELAGACYDSPQLESTRLALLQTRRAIDNSASGRWESSLSAIDLTSEEWLRDLRSVLQELVRLTTERVGDGDEFSSVEALQDEQLRQSLMQA